MGDSLRVFHSSNINNQRAITSKKLSKRCLLSSTPKDSMETTLKCFNSIKQGTIGSGAAVDIGLFLLKTAALDLVRRFSISNCPFAWHTLEALQVLCYPPFRWIQRWAPFKGLVNFMQTLSKPLLVLTVATIFSDQSKCTRKALNNHNGSQSRCDSQSELPAQLLTLDTRSSEEVPKSVVSEKWLLQLHKELERQDITLPERLNKDELCRFYAAANGDFSRLLSSVKRTIRWRQTYTILSPQELEVWSQFVFWHGCDVKLRYCLIIRLGLACSNLRSTDRPLFAKAVVLMDCEGISPFGFPMQMMRSCAILLQDHYPNRLGCLIVTRLPPVARLITQTLFQVLRPATQQKMRIVGGNYQKVLSEYFQTFPAFLGGRCSCPKCSDPSDIQVVNKEIIETKPPADVSSHSYVTSADLGCHTDSSMSENRDHVVRTAIISVLMLWIFTAFIFGMHYHEGLPFSNWQGGS